MRTFVIAASALIFGIVFNASARTPQEIAKEVDDVASKVVAAYKNSGMGGVEAESQGCWREIEKYEFRCMYIDMAARYIDRLAGGGKAFPLNAYFDDNQFGPRAGSLFNAKSIGMGDANKYMATMQPMINGAVDRSLKKPTRSVEACVNTKFSAWERKRDLEIKKWCRDLEKKGQECRISAGVEEEARTEALAKFQAECSK